MDFRGGLCGGEGGEFGTAEYTPNVWLKHGGLTELTKLGDLSKPHIHLMGAQAWGENLAQ